MKKKNSYTHIAMERIRQHRTLTLAELTAGMDVADPRGMVYYMKQITKLPEVLTFEKGIITLTQKGKT